MLPKTPHSLIPISGLYLPFLSLYLFELVVTFIGFALGRYGDKYLGNLEKLWIIPNPHHWIWGALLIFLGGFGSTSFLGLTSICFGIGVFVSDLNDFLHLRFFGEEPPHQWKFWHIN